MALIFSASLRFRLHGHPPLRNSKRGWHHSQRTIHKIPRRWRIVKRLSHQTGDGLAGFFMRSVSFGAAPVRKRDNPTRRG